MISNSSFVIMVKGKDTESTQVLKLPTTVKRIVTLALYIFSYTILNVRHVHETSPLTISKRLENSLEQIAPWESCSCSIIQPLIDIAVQSLNHTAAHTAVQPLIHLSFSIIQLLSCSII
jgi:hypothetical protein